MLQHARRSLSNGEDMSDSPSKLIAALHDLEMRALALKMPRTMKAINQAKNQTGYELVDRANADWMVIGSQIGEAISKAKN